MEESERNEFSSVFDSTSDESLTFQFPPKKHTVLRNVVSSEKANFSEIFAEYDKENNSSQVNFSQSENSSNEFIIPSKRTKKTTVLKNMRHVVETANFSGIFASEMEASDVSLSDMLLDKKEKLNHSRITVFNNKYSGTVCNETSDHNFSAAFSNESCNDQKSDISSNDAESQNKFINLNRDTKNIDEENLSKDQESFNEKTFIVSFNNTTTTDLASNSSTQSTPNNDQCQSSADVSVANSGNPIVDKNSDAENFSKNQVSVDETTNTVSSSDIKSQVLSSTPNDSKCSSKSDSPIVDFNEPVGLIVSEVKNKEYLDSNITEKEIVLDTVTNENSKSDFDNALHNNCTTAIQVFHTEQDIPISDVACPGSPKFAVSRDHSDQTRINNEISSVVETSTIMEKECMDVTTNNASDVFNDTSVSSGNNSTGCIDHKEKTDLENLCQSQDTSNNIKHTFLTDSSSAQFTSSESKCQSSVNSNFSENTTIDTENTDAKNYSEESVSENTTISSNNVESPVRSGSFPEQITPNDNKCHSRSDVPVHNLNESVGATINRIGFTDNNTGNEIVLKTMPNDNDSKCHSNPDVPIHNLNELVGDAINEVEMRYDSIAEKEIVHNVPISDAIVCSENSECSVLSDHCDQTKLNNEASDIECSNITKEEYLDKTVTSASDVFNNMNAFSDHNSIDCIDNGTENTDLVISPQAQDTSMNNTFIIPSSRMKKTTVLKNMQIVREAVNFSGILTSKTETSETNGSFSDTLLDKKGILKRSKIAAFNKYGENENSDLNFSDAFNNESSNGQKLITTGNDIESQNKFFNDTCSETTAINTKNMEVENVFNGCESTDGNKFIISSNNSKSAVFTNNEMENKDLVTAEQETVNNVTAEIPECSVPSDNCDQTRINNEADIITKSFTTTEKEHMDKTAISVSGVLNDSDFSGSNSVDCINNGNENTDHINSSHTGNTSNNTFIIPSTRMKKTTVLKNVQLVRDSVNFSCIFTSEMETNETNGSFSNTLLDENAISKRPKITTFTCKEISAHNFSDAFNTDNLNDRTSNSCGNNIELKNNESVAIAEEGTIINIKKIDVENSSDHKSTDETTFTIPSNNNKTLVLTDSLSEMCAPNNSKHHAGLDASVNISESVRVVANEVKIKGCVEVNIRQNEIVLKNVTKNSALPNFVNEVHDNCTTANTVQSLNVTKQINPIHGSLEKPKCLVSSDHCDETRINNEADIITKSFTITEKEHVDKTANSVSGVSNDNSDFLESNVKENINHINSCHTGDTSLISNNFIDDLVVQDTNVDVAGETFMSVETSNPSERNSSTLMDITNCVTEITEVDSSKTNTHMHVTGENMYNNLDSQPSTSQFSMSFRKRKSNSQSVCRKRNSVNVSHSAALFDNASPENNSSIRKRNKANDSQTTALIENDASLANNRRSTLRKRKSADSSKSAALLENNVSFANNRRSILKKRVSLEDNETTGSCRKKKNTTFADDSANNVFNFSDEYFDGFASAINTNFSQVDTCNSTSIITKVFNRKRNCTSSLNHVSVKTSRAPTKRISASPITKNKAIKKSFKFPKLDTFCTDRFYKHLQEKLEPRYGIRTNKKVLELTKFMVENIRLAVNERTNFKIFVDKVELALFNKGVVITHYNFWNYCLEYLPVWFSDKAVPILQPFGRPTVVDTSIAFDPIA